MARRRCLWLLVILCCILGCYGEENDIARGFSARTMLEKIASSLMSRAGTTTSQVLSLNMTNLLILVLLKALIFAAGSVGAGSWKGGGSGGTGGGYSRNVDEEEGLITDTEMLLYLGYISGAAGSHKCLQNVACHRPKVAAEYAKAGKLLLKTVYSVPNLIEDSTDYELSLAELQEATDYGLQKKGNCDEKYQCTNKKAFVR